MRDQSEICRTAKELLDRYGVAASLHASLRASESLDSGDLAGADVWRRVIDAIEELAAHEPGQADSAKDKGVYP
ncbi:MAG: hypothetical protein ABFS30_04875 [Pseudomonadota bacterium]